MPLCRFFLVFALAFAGFALPSGPAAAAECQAPADAGGFEVRVDFDIKKPDIYHNLSKADLGTTNFHGRRGQILGNTQSSEELRLSSKIEFVERDGVVCFWVTRAEVDISLKQLDVYIATDYEAGSCKYEAVLDHENEHVAVAQSVTGAYAQGVEAALTTARSIPTAERPALAGSPDEARARVNALFQQTLAPVRDKMARVLKAKQAQVDTEENYRKTWQRCSRW